MIDLFAQEPIAVTSRRCSSMASPTRGRRAPAWTMATVAAVTFARPLGGAALLAGGVAVSRALRA